MSSLATLKHVFGSTNTAKDCIWFLDETTIVHVAGKNIVVETAHQTSQQRFIPCALENSEGVSAMCLSPNRKYLAVAEKGEKATVIVYDINLPKRRKILSAPDQVGSREIVSLSFSSDNRTLIAQGGAPEWNLMAWRWEKLRCLGSVCSSDAERSFPVYQCSVNPRDDTMFCVTGDKVFKIFKYKEEQIVQHSSGFAKKESQNYSSHAWLPEDRMVVGTDTGELLIVEGFEYKATLPQSPLSAVAISSLLPCQKGFLAGGNNGTTYLFERTDSREMYNLNNKFEIEVVNTRESVAYPEKRDNAIKSMCISPQEEYLLVATEANQILNLNLAALEYRADEVKFEPFCGSWHSEEITGLDVCVRKPLIATCSLDRTVRIWNYLEDTVEIMKTFDDECYSVAFHPSGFHILVGFRDKLRFMNVLMDDIRTFKELSIRQCRVCKFSHGGHLFAAVNQNLVQVYNSYTCELVGSLRGHSARVRDVSWSKDDSRLVSCGVDGTVYEWDVKEMRRDGDCIVKTCQYSSVVFSEDADAVYVVGSDKEIKEIVSSTVRQSVRSDVAPYSKIAMAYSQRVIIVGSENGFIRLHNFPLQLDSHEDVIAHQGIITGLVLARDESHFFSVSDDRIIMKYELKDREGKQPKSEVSFSEEILVSKTDLEEKMSQIHDLKTKVDELRLENECSLRKRQSEFTEKLKDITDDYERQLTQERSKLKIVEKNSADSKDRYETQLHETREKFLHQIQSLESQYQQKIMAELERVHSLEQDKERVEESFKDRMLDEKERHQEELRTFTEEYEDSLRREQDMCDGLQQEKMELLKEHEEIQAQIEEDADKEIEDLKESYESKLTAEKELVMRLKGDNQVMKRERDEKEKKLRDKSTEIAHLKEEVENLKMQIRGYQKDIKAFRNEIRQRDETIGDKDMRIHELKKKNQELEKFKFVLGYKINELRKEIEPREEEIADMRKQIKEMDKELESYHQLNADHEFTIQEMKLKVESAQKEIATLNKKIKASETFRSRLRKDLHEAMQFIQDPKQLKESFKQVYSRYVDTDFKVQEDVDEDVLKEYQRQIEYLERTAESLKRKLFKDQEGHKVEVSRIMQENVVLIKEINELRREMKVMRSMADPKTAIGRWGSKTIGGGAAESSRDQRDKELEIQRMEIQRLRARIEELEAGRSLSSRPISRERLPPMDGVQRREASSAVGER
eukprot:TRINITY_DN2061_c0_g1_i1.p1 TRINITY_DN2061_c0_g1~~TRINITY_DN2061_c0_g1_i1.p1  ORF type:complete len:1197 (+),score=341.87 TRINITY_DN2061_c0_g1_i1:223-3813(+)